MPRRKVIAEHPASPALDQEIEDLSYHPFIELMARWVREAERERLAQAQAKKPRKPKAVPVRRPVDKDR